MEWKMPRGCSVRRLVFRSWDSSCPKNGMLPTRPKRYQIRGIDINFFPVLRRIFGTVFPGKVEYCRGAAVLVMLEIRTVPQGRNLFVCGNNRPYRTGRRFRACFPASEEAGYHQWSLRDRLEACLGVAH